MTPEEILRAIASLPEDDRRGLLARLNSLYPADSTPRQLDLLSRPASAAPDVILTFDGGSRGNPGPAYGSFALSFAGGPPRVTRLNFGVLTNNEAEYQTLILALNALLEQLASRSRNPAQTNVEVRGDSALVINQLKGEWKAKEPRMRELRDAAQSLLGRFSGVRLVQHPRTKSVDLLGH